MLFGITTHRGIRNEDLAATFYLNSTLPNKDCVGWPVAIDPSADFTVGVAGDGAEIHGVLQSWEDRSQEGGIKTGAVNPLISFKFEYDGVAPTRGGSVVGSAVAGKVKAAGAGAGKNTVVVAVDTAAQTVEVLFR